MKLYLGIVVVVAFYCFPAQVHGQLTKSPFCFVGAHDLADASAPSFGSYKAPGSPTTARRLDLKSNPIARTYRTVLRREVERGANFAGHYRVAVWGCGSSCAQFAIINLNSGKVITIRGVNTVSEVHFGAEDFLPGTDSEDWGFRFKRDSRLLVLVGTLDEDDSRDGAFYYVIENDRIVQVHKTIAKRNTCTAEDK